MRRSLGIGVIGTGWMAKAHARALSVLNAVADLPVRVELVGLAGRDPDRTRHRAEQWGFARHTADWRTLVEDPRVDMVVNVAGNDVHAEPSIAALAAEKYVLCDKPLAIDVGERSAMEAAARRSSAVAVCGYNYRFVPALQVARRMFRAGDFGALRHLSLAYEQDWASPAVARSGWRFEDDRGGSCVYDLSHILDLLHWLCEVPEAVSGTRGTLSELGGTRPVQPGCDPEDSFLTHAALPSGATAALQASRIATGHKGHQCIELIGSAGSFRWDMEEINTLWVATSSPADGVGKGRRRHLLVTEMDDPYMSNWYAPGHGIGWDDTIIHQWLDMIAAILRHDGQRQFAGFDDGALALTFADSIRESAAERRWVRVPHPEPRP